MRVEIVAVGTEILLGQIVDTNSAWIAAELAAAGMDCHHHVAVGDHPGRIAEALRSAAARADAVIVCGGLGPTPDDITREVMAQVMGVDLVHDPAIEARIASMFAARGRPMPSSNLRQAAVPAGARTIAQQPGTAPGLVCPLGRALCYLVPGVPREMREMVSGTVIPELRELAAQRGESAVVVSRMVRTWGISESGLAERLAPRLAALDESPTATIAFLASGPEGIVVRITAKAPDLATARSVLDREQQEVRNLVGRWIFGVDEQSMESVVLAVLRYRGLRLAVAESLTGGYLAGRLCAVPGASDVFRGGIVSYAGEVKHDLLSVPVGPVVSEAAALAMARGVAALMGAETAVATTGVAGPSEQEGRPVGTVCLAVLAPGAERTTTIRLPGHRENVRQLASISALDLLRRLLLE